MMQQHNAEVAKEKAMTVRSINGPAACASTVAKLDPSITVAKTGENTLLLNLPRNIEDIDKATADTSLMSRITRFFA